MGKKFIIRLASVIFIYIISCPLFGQNSNNICFTLDIKNNINNSKTVKLSELGKKPTYIPLETTPECLIRRIRKIIISETYIFISEYNQLLLFDQHGRFVRQIGSSGNGPGEYNSVGDFCIDDLKEEIFIISTSSNRLMVFGYDGKFKYSRTLSFRPAQILFKGNDLMFHLWNIPLKDPGWIITDKNGNIQMVLRNGLIRKNQPGLLINKTPFYYFMNDIHFMEFGNDTLYRFNNGFKKPYGVFFLDDLKMNPDIKISPELIKNISKNFTGKLWLNTVFENKDFMFLQFKISITDSYIRAVLKKSTNNIFFLKNNLFLNDIDGGPGFWPEMTSYEDLMISHIDAFDFLHPDNKTLKVKESPDLINLKKTLTETSNPILMVLK